MFSARPHRPASLLSSFLALVVPTVALAAEEQPGADGDIIVTAQRRDEPVASTPLAISAFREAELVGLRLKDVKDIVTFTPGFSGNSEDSYIDGLAIRGIASNDYGIGGDPSIGIFKDGVYQGRTGSAVTTLFDMEQAEALRGPQSFLFGRNAISGAISTTTNKPKIGRFDAHAYASYASFNQIDVEAAVNLPVNTEIAARLAAYATRYDGWVDNAFTPDMNDRLMGGRKIAIRPSLRFARGPLQLTLAGEYERRELDGTPYRASNDDIEVLGSIGAAIGSELVIRGRAGDVDTDLTDPRDDGTIYGASLFGDLDLGFAALTSIGAYRRHSFYYSEDYDGSRLRLGDFTQRQRGSYLSQELRLVSPGSGKITWSTGLSGYRESVHARFTNEADESLVCRAGYGYDGCDALTQNLFGTRYVPAANGVLVDVNEAQLTSLGLSAYGDMNIWIMANVQVGAGLRYTWDQKKFALNVLQSDSTLGNIWTFAYFTDGFIQAKKSWHGVTPRFYARVEASSEVNLYASITR
ncbi:TonB-dependent receptor, partial [bacterium]